MTEHIKNTRRQLGELGAMAQQTEAAERKILERAESMLDEVQKKIAAARPRARTRERRSPPPRPARDGRGG